MLVRFNAEVGVELVMKLELVKATIEQKAIVSNLLELYAYDFTEYCDFDIGADGFYGYADLPKYWTDPDKYPFIIYIDGKIAGLVLVQRGSPIDYKSDVWDIAEFFIMKKYKRHGIGIAVAIKIWEQYKGPWEVRVLEANHVACSFWSKTISKFAGTDVNKKNIIISNENWFVYNFVSK